MAVSALREMLDKLNADKLETLAKPSPIPCEGHWEHTMDGSEFDCDYEFAGNFGCEDCIVNGGKRDPRVPPVEED